jgi:hypothetical protein
MRRTAVAKKATSDGIAADLKPKSFREAVERLRGIDSKKAKISSINGEIADIYAKATDGSGGIMRQAARAFVAIDGMEPADRLMFMRDFNGLADAAGWESEGTDLVDQAQGNVVKLRLPGGEAAGADAWDEGGEEISDEMADEAAKLDEQTKAKGKGRARSAADKGEPYTGDNSDLAGDE